jgi:hypothetical protein
VPQIWNQSRLGAGARLASPGVGGQKACDSQFVTDAPFQSPAAATVLADAGARTTSQGRDATPLVSGNCGHGNSLAPPRREQGARDERQIHARAYAYARSEPAPSSDSRDTRTGRALLEPLDRSPGPLLVSAASGSLVESAPTVGRPDPLLGPAPRGTGLATFTASGSSRPVRSDHARPYDSLNGERVVRRSTHRGRGRSV